MGSAIQSRNWHGGRSLYFGVALISISVLMLEIGLTRMFSVMFDSHYAFLVISVATLGLGAGGIYVHTLGRKILNNLIPIQNLLPISSGLMALSILGMTIFILKASIFHHILLAALLASAPCFFGGIYLATAFRLFPNGSSKIYAADLIGASIGSLLIVFMLRLGGINVNLLVAFIASLPAGLFILKESSKKIEKVVLLLLMGCLISIFFLNYLSSFLGVIPLTKGAHKEMAHLLAHPARKASVIESRWSAFGRTDLLVDEKDPDEITG